MKQMMTRLADTQRIGYLSRCVSGLWDAERLRCPACAEPQFETIKRKKLLTALVRCTNCRLIYRIPLDPPGFNGDFYQEDYKCLFATDCPDDGRLEQLVASGFIGSSMDYTTRLQMLRALGVAPGARILDFGASWGYGTWQMVAAGYDATGYEIGKPRARYAREKLKAPVVDEVDELSGKFDVFFSSHVLEHLPSPRVAFDLAAARLRAGGLFIAFTPNGSMACLEADPKAYHGYWSAIHPLYLDDLYYRTAFPANPKLICSAPYDREYDWDAIARWDRRSTLSLDLRGSELAVAVVL